MMIIIKTFIESMWHITIVEIIKYRCLLRNKLANNLVIFESGPKGCMQGQTRKQ